MNEIRRSPASPIDREHFPRDETSQIPQDISIEASSALSIRGCTDPRWIQGSSRLRLFNRSVSYGIFGSCTDCDIILYSDFAGTFKSSFSHV